MRTDLIRLPEGFVCRPVEMSDLDACGRLFNDSLEDQIGVRTFTKSEISRRWTAPDFSMERNLRLVLAPNGQVVGFVSVWDLMKPPVDIRVWARVHPDFEGMGIGTYLMAWGQQRARESIAICPPDARVIMTSDCYASHEPSLQLFGDLGLSLVRHFWEMEIVFDGEQPTPTLPEGFTVRNYEHDADLRGLAIALEDAFSDHWGHVPQAIEDRMKRLRHWFEHDEYTTGDVWFLALDGEEIAGICLCRPRGYYDPTQGYVNVLGVRRPWRKRGLGLALLQYAFADFAQRNLTGAQLGVDANSLTGATRLYERAGMHIKYQEECYELELRAGKELSRITLDD